MDKLTPNEVKGIAEQIDAWNRGLPTYDRADWRIHAVIQLDLLIEAYEVIYENRQSEIMFRNEAGKLEPAERIIYYAPEYRLVALSQE